MTLSAKLREEVCKKYNVGSRQLLTKITKKKIEEKIIDRDVALLLLAQEKGMDIHKPRFKVPKEKLEKLERHLAAVKAGLIRAPPVISREKLPSTKPRKAERLYGVGEQYDLWKDLRSILRRSKRQVFVVEPHPNEEIFTLYLDSVPVGIDIRILVNQLHGKFMEVAKKFALKYSVTVKQSSEIHDRHIFVDNRAWVIGSSIKDAAVRKPTYMIELRGRDTFYSMYDDLYTRGKILLK